MNNSTIFARSIISGRGGRRKRRQDIVLDLRPSQCGTAEQKNSYQIRIWIFSVNALAIILELETIRRSGYLSKT